MKTAYLTLGLPGCGKSTWAAALPGHVARVERDAIRAAMAREAAQEFTWATWDFGREPEVQRRWDAAIQAAVESGADLVVSDTNANTRVRRQLAQRLLAAGYGLVYVVFRVDEETCRARNAGRGSRSVQPEAYDKLRAGWSETLAVLEEEAREFGARVIDVG